MKWIPIAILFVAALLLLLLLQHLVFRIGGPAGIAGSIVCVLIVLRLNRTIERLITR